MRKHFIIVLLIGFYLTLHAQPNLHSNDIDCTFDLIKSNLRNNEILIEILVPVDSDFNSEYYALTVKNNYDSPHVTKLFSEQELENELKKGADIFFDTTISEMLLTPLNDELSEIDNIFFIPNCRFHSFPIEYCNVKDGVMLCEKYAFFRLSSSGPLTKRSDNKTLYHSYGIYGGIDYDINPDFEEKYERVEMKKNSHGYLKDSYIAAIDIHNILADAGLKGELYSNDTATEHAFKALSRQDIQLFLIETHSVKFQETSKDPNSLMMAGSSYVMEGGIVPEGKEDGILTLQEIEALDLSHIDLAVISACSSAVDKMDRNSAGGLLRAFKTAGVNSLVMTTNDVVDYVSGEVWKRFFKNIVEGMTKREALINAINNIKVMNDGFYNLPEMWASYILIDGIE